MKKLILLTLILIYGFNTFSQSDMLNHEKYWYYRYRMKSYFTDIGSGTYKSLVYARRNQFTGTHIHAGDQTYDMGWYMCALAAEYNLISETGNEAEINQTLTELYYLLKAFERLDYCESKLDYLENNTSRIDGFFVRQDPEMLDEAVSFDATLQNLNNGLTPEDGFGSRPPGQPTYVNYLNDGLADDELYKYEMSQDQVVGLFLGLATIKRAFKYHYQSSFYNVITNQTIPFDFNDKMINISSRLLNYIHNFPPQQGTFAWYIYNPDGNVVPRDGYDCSFYSYGFAKLASWLIESNLFYDNTAISVGIPAWQSLAHYENPTTFNNVMELILGTISNSWTMPRDPVFPFINIEPTDYYIYHKSLAYNHDYFFIMLYRYLHEKDSPYERTGNIAGIIDNAPFCGPYRYTDGYEYAGEMVDAYPQGNTGWASHNRYRRKITEANGNHGERGNFPGLDYMVTYNLYRKLHGGATYRNMINSFLIDDYPYQQNGQWYGTENNPANLRAFESFECNNEIETNSNGDGSLNLIASNSIKLTPGFHVYQGAHFSAKVEEFDCWEAGGNGNNKSSYFHDNGYVYNYNPDPMEVIDDEMLEQTENQYKNEIVENSLLVIPNPAKNQIQFQFETANISSYSLIIRDVYGNTIITETNYQSGAILNISTLSNGIYIAEVVINGQVYQESLW